jgi:phosphoribosyl-dephospho-CoA transferase
MHNCRAPQRRVRDVSQTRAGVTEETMSRKSPPVRRRKCRLVERHARIVTRSRSRNHVYNAPTAIFCTASGTRSREIR